MKRLKTLLAAFVVALMSAVIIVPIAACAPDGDAEGSNAIFVTSMGGMALQNVTVEVSNGTASLGKKVTNEEGKVSYNLDNGNSYTLTLSDVPAGFEYDANYTVNGSDKEIYIRLDSHVIENGSPTKTYAIGDVLYDFEQTYYYYDGTTIQTKTVKLSDVLKEKRAVLINFFYVDCYWCNQEYPALKSSYLAYADQLEILAINDYSAESQSKVTSLVQSDEVPYLMCKDNANVGRWFTKSGWPTSFIIDRYGILCDYTTTQVQSSYWMSLFEKYTSDDYSQNFTQGGDSSDVFIADKPEDFGVSMPTTQVLNSNSSLNSTGRTIAFSEDATKTSEGGKYFWPWDLTADGTAIYPTNSGHAGTLGAIYLQINLNANEVFAFDYKLSTLENYDYFYVSIDSRLSTGRQISMESGIKDWQTGFAYVALEAGQHEICFLYYKSTASSSLNLDDKAYIKNIRIMSVSDMNAELVSRNETLEIPYFATREYSSESKQFSVIENVYIADDGYYHLGTKANASASDPYLLLDLTHSTPYFGSNSDNLYNLYYSYKNKNGSLKINNVDYSNDFESYIIYSGNSDYSGMIPVTEDIKNVLSILYDYDILKDFNGIIPPYYDNTGRGWMQFCVAYRQYGVQKTVNDPIKGLAYFSSFDMTESTPDQDTYVKAPAGTTGQFIKENGVYIDVEGTSRASEGEYVLADYVNEAHFDKIIMPLGYMYKFVPEKTGVYNIHGVDCYYWNEADETAVIDGEETDACLYDDTLKVSHVLANPLVTSDSDRYFRKEDASSFKIYYYLEANKTYYLCVNFRVVETTGDFAFRADYIGTSFEYLHQATSDYYVPDENYKLHINTYVDPVYDENLGYYVDSKNGGAIYADMTELTFLFSNVTIEYIVNHPETYKDPFDFTGLPDLDEYFNGNKPDSFKDVVVADYTDAIKQYVERSKEVGEDSMFYGLVPVDKQLYSILQLFNLKYTGYDDDNEWLKACWFLEKLGAPTV